MLEKHIHITFLHLMPQKEKKKKETYTQQPTHDHQLESNQTNRQTNKKTNIVNIKTKEESAITYKKIITSINV